MSLKLNAIYNRSRITLVKDKIVNAFYILLSTLDYYIPKGQEV